MEGDVTASFDDVKVTKHCASVRARPWCGLKPEEFAQLKVQNPKLWWPNGYGEPALHHLTVGFACGCGDKLQSSQIDFGMREVSYELSLFDATGHLRRVEVLPSRTHDAALPLIDEKHKGIRQIDDWTPNQVIGPATPR